MKARSNNHKNSSKNSSGDHRNLESGESQKMIRIVGPSKREDVTPIKIKDPHIHELLENANYFKFIQPCKEPLNCNINLHNLNDFKDFIKSLKPDANLTKFTCGKLKRELLNEFAIVITSRIQQDRTMSRAIAEVCGKISIKNAEFPFMIASTCKNLFLHLVRAPKSFIEFLEFFTMLNKHCACKSCLNLIKFAFFAIAEDEICFKNNFGAVDEFVVHNMERIPLLKVYVAGDIFYKMRQQSEMKKEFYGFYLSHFDPKYNTLYPHGRRASPSFQRAMNHVLCVRVNFQDIYEEPEDLRIVNIKECAFFFFRNATTVAFVSRVHNGNLIPHCVQLLKFLERNQPKKIFEKFMKQVVYFLVDGFYDVCVKTSIDSADACKSYLMVIIEIYRQNLMENDQFKTIVKIVVDRFMTDDNNVSKGCLEMVTKIYIERNPKDKRMASFISLNEKMLNKMKRYKKKEVKKEVKEVVKSKEPKNVRQTRGTRAERIGSNVQRVNPQPKELKPSELQEFINVLVKGVCFASGRTKKIELADCCLDYNAVFGTDQMREKIFNALIGTFMDEKQKEGHKIPDLSNLEVQRSSGNLQEFMGLLYYKGFLNGSQISVLLEFLQDDPKSLMEVMDMIGVRLLENDREQYFEIADEVNDKLKNEILYSELRSIDPFDEGFKNVYPSFKELVRTIEKGEELFMKNVKVDDPRDAAKYFYHRAIE